MHGRPEELIKTDHRMHHNQANHKHAKHHKMCCDFFIMCYPVRQRTGSFTTTDFTDWTDRVLWRIEEIKKFVAFPRLTPLQPDAYAQPRKRASLSDPPHPSGLPTGRQKATKQNSCPWQYKMSLRRRLRTITLDLQGAYPLAYCHPGRG